MKLSLVTPCYNEAENVGVFAEQAKQILKGIDYEIVFINDGSKDNTMKCLREIYAENPKTTKVINFSRNFGKEAGLYAGLQHAKGDYVVVIDADLQQPIEVAREMFEFLEEHAEYDAVAAYQDKRKESKVLTGFKSLFYNMINHLADIPFYKNASDFRCMRRNVVEAILSMSEYHRFSKGIFSWVGFETYYRPYEVRERNAGRTSWSFFKLFNYAIEGMVSFSTKPLKMITTVGLMISVLAVIYMFVVIIQKLFWGIDIPGYPTIIVLILLFGGLQLTVQGIIGEYLAKVHIEVKNRPIYIAKEVLSDEDVEA